MRPSGGADELVELELDRLGVAILCILNKKHHQEGDDGRGGVDDQLPSVTELEDRSGDDPDRDDAYRKYKHSGATAEMCRRLGKPGVPTRFRHVYPPSARVERCNDSAAAFRDLECSGGRSVRAQAGVVGYRPTAP